MRDVTFEEMKTFLLTLKIYEASEFDIAQAIYWFSNNWHGGQFTNLYSAICESCYNPSPIESEPSTDEVAGMLIEELESAFTLGVVE